MLKWEKILVLFVVTLALCHTVWRLYFGVDFADEAWYLVLGHRFSSGDLPLVDEQNLAQSMGLLIAPLVWIYKKLTGSLEGGILFSRYAYLFMVSSVSVFLFSKLRNTFSSALCALAIVINLIYFPIGIPTLSYYTMGSAFFALGLYVQIFNANSILAGFFHALAVTAFPPLILAVAFNFFWNAGRAKYLVAGIATGLALCVVYKITPDAFRLFFESLSNKHSIHTEFVGSTHLIEAAKDFFFYLGKSGFFVFSLALFFAFRHKLSGFKKTVLLVGIAFLVILGSRPSANGIGSAGIIIQFALLGPFFAYFSTENISKLFKLVWAPSIVAGLSMYIGSTNGLHLAATGFLPAFFLGLILYLNALKTDNKIEYPAIFTGILLVFVFLFYQRTVYNEGRVQDLTAKVETGPYAGLYTHPVKKQFIDLLQPELLELNKTYSHLFVYPHFPAANLFFTGGSAGTSTWDVCNGVHSKDCIEKIRKRHGSKVLVLLLKLHPIKPIDYNRYDDIQTFDFIEEISDRVLIDKKEYSVFDGFRPSASPGT